MKGKQNAYSLQQNKKFVLDKGYSLRQRTILGKDPAGMDVPIQIDKDLYFEAKFDTEALLTMMEKKVLGPVGYDFSGIVIQYTEKKPAISESLKSVQGEGREEMPEEEQSGGMTLS